MQKNPEKYEMIAHSWKLNVAGKQVCNTCGLVALNNDFTRWAMNKGCMNHLHPDFKNAYRRYTKQFDW